MEEQVLPPSFRGAQLSTDGGRSRTEGIARALAHIGVGDNCRAMIEIGKSVAYFLLAGLCEIGGGYLVWLWLREGRSWKHGLAGAAVLVLYGVIPTLQPASFGRVYAAYGGVFIALSLLWGWRIDGVAPDRFDLIGAATALLGVAVMMYWPRG